MAVVKNTEQGAERQKQQNRWQLRVVKTESREQLEN
jgi:hypothetical protein